MTRVLIALDDSPHAHSAAVAAHNLFGDDAEYLAICVFERSDTGAAMRDPITWGMVWQYDVYAAAQTDADTARQLAEHEARECAEECGFGEVEAIGEVGDPAHAIIEAAHGHDVDCIVVGSHDRSWFSRLFSPSVTNEVVKRADIPVIVAK